MQQKLNPKMLWGRLQQLDSYHRLEMSCANKKIEKYLQYNCGLFYSFSCKTAHIKIKYNIHYSEKFDWRHPVALKAELCLMGRLKNSSHWITLTAGTGTIFKADAVCDKDQFVNYNLHGVDYDEFILCLPPQGKTNYIIVDTDSKITYNKPKKVRNVIVGSSVGADNTHFPTESLSVFAYTIAGLNLANISVPTAHTFLSNELIELIKTNKTLNFICADFEHITQAELDKVKNLNIKYKILTEQNRPDSYKLALNNNLKPIILNSSCKRDACHLNALGSWKYINLLIEEGVFEYEDSSN